MTIEIMLPLPPVELSPNGRVHWRKKHQKADEYKSDCLALLLNQRIAPFREITLHWTLFTARLRNSKGRVIPDGLYRPKDKDNAIGALKYAQDAIVAARIVANDNADRVKIADPVIKGQLESKGERGALLRIEGVR